MVPTVQVGDYILTQRPPAGGPAIRSGDIIAFRFPAHEGEAEIDYIKRVIGLPGDRVQMKQGVLWINGLPVKRERIADYVDARGHVAPRYVETLPNGASYAILEADEDRGPFDNTEEFLVEPDHYFVMGDNRDDSMDSRMAHLGQVPAGNVIGRAVVVYWSGDRSRIATIL